MVNFRKSVTRSGKQTSCFHGLSWQPRKQYKSDIDEKFFERPSDAYVSTIKISFQLKLELGGRVHSTPSPPPRSRCGLKTPWAGEG